MKVEIAGLPVEVVSPEAAEQADAVICALAVGPRYFRDDVETTCHDCRRGIIHRPHAPKRPIKLCMDCVIARSQGGRA